MQRIALLSSVLFVSTALHSASATERVLYSFQGGNDGAAPVAAMTVGRNGNLYGTTSLGGGSGSCHNGCGTVFELAPGKGGAWTEHVLYSFQGGSDGIDPQAALIADASGNLYGTTSYGGSGNCSVLNQYGCGIAFELSPPATKGGTWTETVLYNFQGVPSGKGFGDVAVPNGLVFTEKGNIFGLAYSGGYCQTDETGTYCYGGAFELKKPGKGSTWQEKVLYRFKVVSGDPAGPVLDSAGNLYGTAPGGTYGCGSVFELTPPASGGGVWTESTVYAFMCGSDGAFPVPGIVFDGSGNLYGMSIGAYSNPSNVFELSPGQSGWSETTLYSFSQTTDGYAPSQGPIMSAGGDLYGATEGGGQKGIGVVFSLAPGGGSWQETVLHSFAGGSDGAAPFGRLVFGTGGGLFGTTESGGSGKGCGNSSGCGTVFKVMP